MHNDPIEQARKAIDALEHGGNWSNFDAPALVRRLLAVIDAQALTIAATEQQRDEARAIIEGSDVPPNVAETRENQCWLAFNRWGAHSVSFALNNADAAWIGNDEYVWSLADAIEHLSPCRWVPLDADNGFRPRKRAAVTP